MSTVTGFAADAVGAAGPVFFSQNPLDRLHALRHDDAALARRLTPDAVFVPMIGVNPIVSKSNGNRPLFLRGFSRFAASARDVPTNCVLLGEHVRDKCAYFAVDVNKTSFEFRDEKSVDLRLLIGALDDEEAAILCHAKALLGWHLAHQHCSKCGARTTISEGGMKRHCDACGAQHFPRTDPVVISLVYHGERVLLGRQSVWPKGRYSCVAGFLDAGETIEQAVQREVFEETGVRVHRVRYHVSQPWPNTSQLMIGCFSEALDDKVSLNDKELEDARWFSADELRVAMAQPDTPWSAASSAALALPSRHAAAHLLISGFLRGEHKSLPSKREQ